MIGIQRVVDVRASPPSYQMLTSTTHVNERRNMMISSVQLTDSLLCVDHLPRQVYDDVILIIFGARTVRATRQISGFAC